MDAPKLTDTDLLLVLEYIHTVYSLYCCRTLRFTIGNCVLEWVLLGQSDQIKLQGVQTRFDFFEIDTVRSINIFETN